ncbi:MAG: HEPN domain-containing protein [Phycisphaerales bacterium JB039]
MQQADLKKLAELRLKEARALFRQRLYAGAYYLAGYAIECALKACVAKQTRRYEFPDKQRAHDVFTHDLARLVKAAGLAQALAAQSRQDTVFEVNWNLVKDWQAESRYSFRKRAEAQDLLDAIDDPTRGVLQWVKRHW